MKLDRESMPFLAGLGVLCVAAVVWAPWTLLLLVPAPGFTPWFFRDPDRVPPRDRGGILSPADGRVVRAGPDAVSVFLNIFAVHVCRSPVAGRVVSVDHVSGTFLAAFRDDASEHNERAEIVLETESGRTKLV